MRNLLLSLLFLGVAFFSHTSIFAQNFYDADKIQEIRIQFQDEDWQYLLDSLKKHDGGRILADLMINGTYYKDVGIRYRGSSSYTYAGSKNPFNIKLSYTDSTQRINDVKTIKLSNLTSDPSYIREVLAYEIARDYMPAPEANYAKVFINGRYEGLYTNIESINSTFLKKHFGSSENAFYKCTPYKRKTQNKECLKGFYASLMYQGGKDVCYDGVYEDKNEVGYKPLDNLMRVLKEEPDKIEDVLNVHATLWMHAFNNVVVNLSSYSGKFSHNYYLYQDNDGKFHPIIWDMNLAFGSFKSTGDGPSLSVDQIHKMDPLLHASNTQKPLIQALLQNTRYKKMYLAFVRTLLREHFRNQSYLVRAKTLQKMISTPIKDDWNTYFEHWQFEKSLDEITNEGTEDIPGLANFMTERTTFLRGHDAMLAYYPSVELRTYNPTKLDAKGQMTIKAKVGRKPTSVNLYYRNEGETQYQMASMLDDGKHQDGAKKDGIFAAQIPAAKDAVIEYYIMAENKGAIRFEPQNFFTKPHQIVGE